MPKLSEFFGIAIYMYWREHPPAHFHARYSGDEVLIAIDDLSVLEGSVSPRALGLIIEWATQHQAELQKAWREVQSYTTPQKIEPLRYAIMRYRVVAAKALPNYRLWVRFQDGVEGEVDLSDLVGRGVFSRWEDPSEFEQVHVDAELGTVAWPGDLDLAPDALYRDIAGVAADSR